MGAGYTSIRELLTFLSDELPSPKLWTSVNGSGAELHSRGSDIAVDGQYDSRPSMFAARRGANDAGLVFPAKLQRAFFGAMPVPRAARHYAFPFQHRGLGCREDTNPYGLGHRHPWGHTTFLIRPSAPLMEHDGGGPGRALNQHHLAKAVLAEQDARY